MLTLAMHCQMAFPATGKVYDEAIKYAKSFSDVWFAKRIEIVNWVKEQSVYRKMELMECWSDGLMDSGRSTFTAGYSMTGCYSMIRDSDESRRLYV